MLILIIILPMLGFLSGSLFGKAIGSSGTKTITTLSTALSFLLSLYFLCVIVKTGNVYILNFSSWLLVDTLAVNWCFYIDSLTAIMLCVITFISTLVHLYSIEYMSTDPHLTRFMSYLSLFTFFMLILVTANNFIQMFVGWEGVGVSSYLLINFWFTRIQANKAAIKAMLINRIGDFALLISIFLIYFIFNSLDYEIVFSLVPLLYNTFIIFGGLHIPVIDLICLFLFFGAMGKSAQLGLHTWLPDAMEGPTPVSALIHAATMVTAGVFLIARCSYLFEFSPQICNFIVLIGSMTAFFAATTGLFQNDIKKVIAYSTCSQLGYMVFACGLSNYNVGLFHLSNHAFFKALLFLGAGSIIHALSDEQDLRKMGGLKRILPFSYAIMLIGSLALIGFPFLAGFYSKDVILEVSFAKYNVVGHFSFILGTLAAFCTAFYSIRLLYLVFLANTNANKNVMYSVHEGSWKLTSPLFILSLLSLFIGFLTKEIFIGFGTDFWGSALFINPFNYVLTDIEFLLPKYKLMPLVFTMLGATFAFFLYSKYNTNFYKVKQTFFFKSIYLFFNKKWFIDRLYTKFISSNILNLSFNFFYVEVDRGLLEKVGPTGIINNLTSIINNFNQIFFKNNLLNIIFYLVLGLILTQVIFFFFQI